MSGFSVGEHIINEIFGGFRQRIWITGEQTEAVNNLLDVAQLRQDCQLLILQTTSQGNDGQQQCCL